jgi:Lactate dehydrogenase and related dehydrogenases
MAVHSPYRRRLLPDLAAEVGAPSWACLVQMLARVDVISVPCPHAPAAFPLLSERRLALVSPSASLVDLARGEVVVVAALFALLAWGSLAGAGLVVFGLGPAVRSVFLSLRHVVLLPHLGSASLAGRL